jgi:hypothetical protein
MTTSIIEITSVLRSSKSQRADSRGAPPPESIASISSSANGARTAVASDAAVDDEAEAVLVLVLEADPLVSFRSDNE